MIITNIEMTTQYIQDKPTCTHAHTQTLLGSLSSLLFVLMIRWKIYFQCLPTAAYMKFQNPFLKSKRHTVSTLLKSP